jgi:hypothetical protein
VPLLPFDRKVNCLGSGVGKGARALVLGFELVHSLIFYH